MNEAMKISARGVAFIAGFEKCKLQASRCPGGTFDIAYGCTTWPPAPGETEGRPIAATDTCTQDQALQLFAYHLTRFEEVVEREVKCPLLQHQYDALVSFAYNVGAKAFADSTVVTELNREGGPRWADAAAAMGWYKYSMLEPHEQGPDDPDRWFRSPPDEAGSARPCGYRRQLRGLLRRHYAEACMMLGFDWQVATADDKDRKRANDAIRLRTMFMWNSEKGWNEDITEEQTQWEDVIDVARRHPLPALAEPAKAPTEAAGGRSGPVAQTHAAGARPAPPPAPAPRPRPELNLPPVTPYIPPPVLRPMEKTRRFWGAALFYGGKIFMAVGLSTLPGRGAVLFGEAWGAVVKDPVLFGMAIDTLTFGTGFAMDHCGAWIRKWGERRARGPMVSGNEIARIEARVNVAVGGG